MYAPALLPSPAPVPPAVLAAEAALLVRDGPYHVGEAYFANPDGAAIQRRWQAELQVRAEARAASVFAECVYCHDEILPSQESVLLAGARLHRECAHEWDCFANGPTEAEMKEQMDGFDAPVEEAA
ncbi:MAG: hypothetical protein H0T48_07335 [Gemmatimonadaceae bacterium]|nr:hypothetical protein [Gemmatimonadaceae bacterium]